MNEAIAHINSYFSSETDLASSFSNWPEFIEGKTYDALLRSSEGENVSTKYIDNSDEAYIEVKSSSDNLLFQRVLGHTVYMLAQRSDHLLVRRISK